MLQNSQHKETIGVFYLARGAEVAAFEKFRRFASSYLTYSAGADHKLYVIFKGFKSAAECFRSRSIFSEIEHEGIFTDDLEFDLGAYFHAAKGVAHDRVCFLNTSSEINADYWLAKLNVNLSLSKVGIVGASGSFEAPMYPGQNNISFPNVHIRTNGFLIRREDFLKAHEGRSFATKEAVHLMEHGAAGLTRSILDSGRYPLVVGKNGRGYAPPFWAISETFRQGNQENLLILDNQTNYFKHAPFAMKHQLFHLAWRKREIRLDLMGLQPSQIVSTAKS